MKTVLRLRNRSLFLFVLLEIVLLLIPVPFLRAAWDYFGPPKDYGAIAFYLLAYGGYFTAANAFFGIAEHFWNWANRKPEHPSDSHRVTARPLPPIPALHFLPPPPPDFTGRSTEITQLLNDLRGGTHVAISGLAGMGGVGKTALALVVAHELSAEYSDAQIYLELRGTSTAPLSAKETMMQVIHAFEPTADLEKATDTEIAGLYRSLLDGRAVLLLLDNAADAAQVRPLIPPSNCALILTSRHYFVLPGMQPLRLDVMRDEDARKFLIKICPRIEIYPDEIAQLCGYLPLALRIAASTLAERPDIDPKQYAANLSDRRTRLAQLKSASDPALNVQAAFELSYDLLSPMVKSCWRALAVFAGQFNWIAAAEVWALSDAMTQQTLSDFVRSSFVDYDRENERYHLHELLAAYADRLLIGRERETVQSRHAQHYLAAACHTHRLYVKGGNSILEALWLFDKEWQNIKSAYDWSVAAASSRTKAAEFCNEFGFAAIHCMNHRLTATGRINWLKPALVASRKLRHKPSESTHLGNLGRAYLELGDDQNAIQSFEQALNLDRETGNIEGQAKSLGNLGSAMQKLGRIEKGIELSSQALAIHTQIGDICSQATDLGNLGTAYRKLGQLPLAFTYHSRALVLAKNVGDKRGEAIWLTHLGHDLSGLGLEDQVSGLHKDALAIARQLHDKSLEGMALTESGLHHLNPDQIRTAVMYFEEALGTVRRTGNKSDESEYLANLGTAYAGLGERDRALDLYHQALTIAREIGDRRREAECLDSLARVYLFLSDVPNAIDNLHQARAIYHELPDKHEESKTLGLLGDILKRASRITEAEDMYKKALQVDPSNTWTLVDLIWLYHKENREPEAIPYLEEATRLDPTNPDSLLVLASIHRKQRNTVASEAYSERARAPIPPTAWYWLASVESIRGNVDLAFDYLRRAAEEAGFDRAGAWRNWNLDWIRNDPRFEQIVGPRPKQSPSPRASPHK